MIKKLVRQMLTAQILSALTVSLCLLIDNIMIGRFLGVDAIAAYGLANPILLIAGAIGSMIAAGCQVACSRSLGRGSREETDTGYSTAIALTLGIACGIVLIVVVLRTPIALLMGAGKSESLLYETKNYIAGFIIGAPAFMGALILVPFLQMAGKSNLLIAAVLGMTVGDVAFDLLNVLVFDGGMFGMGLASSLSYYLALAIGAVYFLSKKCIFRFSRKLIKKEKVTEILRGGVPSVFTMASSVIAVFALNRLLLPLGGSEAVAAFAIINTVSGACNCVSTGMGGVSLTLSGILYNEEDRNGLNDLFRTLVRYAAVLGFCAAMILFVMAPAFVSLFIKEAGTARTMAVTGSRIIAFGMLPCCINNAFKSCYQGTGRVRETEIISLVQGAVLPVLMAWILSILTDLTGTWFYYIAAETLTLLGILLTVRIRRKTAVPKADDLLLLSSDFGVLDRDLMERDIRSLKDVTDAAEAAGAFCREKGLSPRDANRIALCIEEMAVNTVKHGFSKSGGNHLSLRLLRKNDRFVLRFRDDCRAFDPAHYIPRSEESGKDLGIRLMLAMSDEVRYTYSMNLNNLTLLFREKPSPDKTSA